MHLLYFALSVTRRHAVVCLAGIAPLDSPSLINPLSSSMKSHSFCLYSIGEENAKGGGVLKEKKENILPNQLPAHLVAPRSCWPRVIEWPME